MCLQWPLLKKFNIRPAVKGTLFKGPRSIFGEQTVKDEFGAERQEIDNWYSLAQTSTEILQLRHILLREAGDSFSLARDK